ncbi:MAG: DUF6198 family protein [Sporomusaceae bacterium]|nr:DUF6198 family protein [Sporomusaceae bacterium]
MNKKNLVKRYIIFIFGLFFNAFGVAFVTKAALGASPIAAIPYSLSLIIPKLSLGNWTILFNILLVLIQLIILRKAANKLELLLQVVICFFFGSFIDLSMIVLSGFAPQAYLVMIISLLIGCAIIAFGAYLEVIADVVMLSGDAFIRTLAKVLCKEYGVVRVISDSSMTVIAGILCMIMLGKLSGVREGTVIAALIIGYMVRFFTLKFQTLTFLLLPENRKSEEHDISIPSRIL